MSKGVDARNAGPTMAMYVLPRHTGAERLSKADTAFKFRMVNLDALAPVFLAQRVTS